MRGAFVACFGEVDQSQLERVADSHRWHGGAPEYHAVPGLHVAAQAHSLDGPHVEIRDGRASIVHGSPRGGFDDLQRRGRRFVAVECDGETLRAARDPMGLAALFYRVIGRSLWLATEVSPLVALGGLSPDLAALSLQAALVPDDARTGFVGIQRLLPGGSLHVGRNLLPSQHRYWHAAALFGRFSGDRTEAADELWARLLEGVDRSLEGPTGVLVSGGLDSAAVTAAAALLGRPLSLVHVAFPEFADAAEEPYARAVAASARAELEVLSGNAGPWNPEEDLELSVIPYLTPPGYTANVGLARLAERGVAVALDGNDGDGVLGYSGREWGELLTTGAVRPLWRLAATYGARRVVRGVASDVLPPAVPDILRRRHPRPPTYLEHIERYFDPSLHERMRSVDHDRWRPPIREWRRRQLRQVSPVTTVRMEEHELRGARFGVDLRHPFADRELVEFLVSLPASIKSDPMRSKALLRDALAGHAPDEVVQRSEKPGYLSVLERRVDRGRCLDWVKESGIRLPFVNYENLFRDGAEPQGVPLFLLLLLARAHVFAAGQ
jgi:asparagine synthase (glutamine-hydrolysing)